MTELQSERKGVKNVNALIFSRGVPMVKTNALVSTLLFRCGFFFTAIKQKIVEKHCKVLYSKNCSILTTDRKDM